MFNQDNYFALFDLPVSLPVDLSLLNARYQQLQRQYHPDNYVTESDSKKAEVLQKSALINTAYQKLKNPEKAAEYRLALEGIDINVDTNVVHDPDFLMTQFELRERLDDIEQNQDWLSLDKFYHEIAQYKKEVHQELLHKITNENWDDAKFSVYQLRYISRLIEQIELIQEKQFDL